MLFVEILEAKKIIFVKVFTNILCTTFYVDSTTNHFNVLQFSLKLNLLIALNATL